jgi:hypothetical protein
MVTPLAGFKEVEIRNHLQEMNARTIKVGRYIENSNQYASTAGLNQKRIK